MTDDTTSDGAATGIAGAKNLLLECVNLNPGERVLLVREDAAEGFYDAQAPACVADVARSLGAHVTDIEVNVAKTTEHIPDTLAHAITQADHTIFFSRIGDQVRFSGLPGHGTKTMCYALDGGFLDSELCTLSHTLMQRVLALFVEDIQDKTRWHMQCPLGTDASGEFTIPRSGNKHDFSVQLFPTMIFSPISCASMSGKVALGRWLSSTSVNVYESSVLPLNGPVTALIDQGRIIDFSGSRAEVSAVRAQYVRVAEKFNIDPNTVDSWHTGIHPKTFYPFAAQENIERWGSVAFGSPRYTHFHTCGTNPGEICWSLFDCTITFDDEVYWQDGQFVFLQRDDIKQRLAEQCPHSPTALDMRFDIGI